MSEQRREMTQRYGMDRQSSDTGDQPLFRVLSDEKRDRMHEASIEVLQTVGLQVTRPEAAEMMGDAGCEVDGDTVRVPRQVFEDALDSAPKQITLYDRDGNPAMHLGGTEVYGSAGTSDLEYFDIETGEKKLCTFDHARDLITVADALPNVNTVGNPGFVHPTTENPLEVTNQLEFEIMLTYTSKPLRLMLPSGGEVQQDCFEMAEAVAVANGAESLGARPFVLPMLCPISPLIYNEDTVDKLLHSVDWGVPVACGSMPMAGGTSPVTIASTIVQCNVEALFGLVMSQIRRKGAPYVMSTYASATDMMTGEPARGPEGMLAVASCLELGHYYGIPITGGGFNGGRYGIMDAEAGWDQGVRGLLRMLLPGNTFIGLGGMSLHSLVRADEGLGMLKALMKGVEVSDETLAVDVMRDIGPGAGTFLGHEHTFRHFNEHWRPSLIPRGKYEDWDAAGRKTTWDYTTERIREFLATHKPKPLPQAAKKKIDEVIARARERAAVPV